MSHQETLQVASHEDDVAAAMEDMDHQLEALQSNQQCSWCLLFKESLEMKLHGKNCKACASVQQMLWRHLGSSEEALASFTKSEQVDFFQDAAKTVDMETGGRWTLLIERQSKVVERLQSLSVGSDYVPIMSVWENRGWNQEDVLSFNDSEELPNGTKTYRCRRCHIKIKADAENKRTVEEALLERERECKKCRVPKAKAKGKGKLGGQPAATEQVKMESDCWLVNTDSETEMPQRTESKRD